MVMIKAFLCDEYALSRCVSDGVFAFFLDHIKKHQLAFVLLTNPLDSLTIIQNQLQATPQLADTNQYTFITHHENSHFNRHEHPFFAEILGRVGIEPNEAFVLSCDIADISTARCVGINGFQIQENLVYRDMSYITGGWSDFIQFLAQDDWERHYPPIPLASHMIIPQLRGNMGALRGLLGHIKPEFWHQHPDPQEWSPYQIVCHLLESEDSVQRARLEKILAQDNPFLSQNLVAPTPKCDLDETSLVDLFYITRQKTIDWLDTLPMSVWERVARHSIFGPTTFLEMAHFTAQHDRLHLNQLCQTLQKCR